MRVAEKKAVDPNINFTVEVSYIEVRASCDHVYGQTDPRVDLQRESARLAQPQELREPACSRTPEPWALRRGSIEAHGQ